jgi:flagellar transcriptional activator FlhD
MNTDQITQEIREVNLACLMLAQQLLRTDRAEALYRLGLTEEAAAVLESLTPAQLVRIAASSTLLWRPRVDDELVWSLLASHSRDGSAPAALHASILMAGRAGAAVAA